MKIAILNDSPAAIAAMRRVLEGSGKYRIAWTAGAGADAVGLCQNDPPDLLLVDVSASGTDGVETIRRIMDASPCAILIVTEAMEENSAKVFDAMGAGALDVVQAPCVDASKKNGASSFIGKIDSIAFLIDQAAAKPVGGRHPQCARQLVAIGSSAGGPAALSSLLRDLPADFPAAVIIVQHIDAQFAPGLAKWLGQQSKLPVKAAVAGDMPVTGTVLLAATNDHLVFETPSRLGYTPHPVDYSYRPSVNAFFESSARHWRGSMIGVLLTGMGSDGANGLKMLRNLGHHTIAQDQKTSAVYGMPRAAVKLQAAAEILPLDRIAPALCRYFHPNHNHAVPAVPLQAAHHG
ncbi:MAG: chemotaxis-specific protein-glutamate methyltransferase CheB [Chthoniobacteraceae bacterium]|jgi:chemotaxis response regulator CheB